MKKKLLYIGAPFILAACSMAPEYVRPELPVLDTFPTEAVAPGVQYFAHDISWREYFKDDRLIRYIDTALLNNKDMKLALLNVEAARLAYGITDADRYPGINAGGQSSRSKTGSANTQPGMGSQITERHTVNLGVSNFELDFFGRVKSMSDAALNEYFATVEGQKAVRIALIAQVARSYVAERLAGEQLQLARETLSANQASYNLVKQQVDAGIANDLDLAQALGQVHSARVQVAKFEREQATALNALNELVGGEPLSLPRGLSLRNQFFDDLPVGLPSEVLLVRPDVAEAEYKLKAANANIGAARAAFFPSISLTATANRMSSSFSDLFSSGTSGWTFSPAISLPIFNWGKTKANLDLAHVRTNMAVVNYEKAIQQAFREVADGLVSRAPLEKQLRAQRNLVATTSEQLRLANLLYTNGIASYLDVLDAQRTLFNARQALLGTYFEKIMNGISLYAALGGGLERTEVSDFVAVEE